MATTNHFTTVEKFEAKIKKLAADNNLVLASADSEVALRRLENAYNIILAALVIRGLTVVEVSTWARGEEFQLDIATYWYCKDCGWGGKDVDTVDWTKVFDREKELTTVPVLNSLGETLLGYEGTVAVGMDLLQMEANLGETW